MIGDWWHNFWLHRDNVSLETVQNPRYFFEEFAARPRPAAPEAAPAAPVAAAPAAASPAIDPKSVVGENAPVAGEKADDAAPVETETPAKKAPAKKVPAKKAPAKAKSQA